jgi:hypothetical protein
VLYFNDASPICPVDAQRYQGRIVQIYLFSHRFQLNHFGQQVYIRSWPNPMLRLVHDLVSVCRPLFEADTWFQSPFQKHSLTAIECLPAFG